MTIAENSMQRPSLTSLTRKAGAVTALALGLLVSGAYAKIDDSARYEPVAPTIDQARANILIARQLQFTHFRNLGISIPKVRVIRLPMQRRESL